MRAATPVVRISAQSAADAAAGDGSAPREHVPQQRNSARDVSALPHSAPRRRRQTALNASCSVAHRPAQGCGTVPLVAIRWAGRQWRPRRSSPRSRMPHTAPLDACTRHLHRRYAGNAESARCLIACHAPLDKLARWGSRAAFRALRRSGSAPCRRANVREASRSRIRRALRARYVPAHLHTLHLSHPSTFPTIHSSIADTQGRPDNHVPACDDQPHNGAARSSS